MIEHSEKRRGEERREGGGASSSYLRKTDYLYRQICKKAISVLL